MFRKILKIFLIFLFFNISNSYALNDIVRDTDYHVSGGYWKCDVEELSAWPYWGTAGGDGGDLSIELGNEMCAAEVVSEFLLLKYGNAYVKLAGTAALVATVGITYSIASDRFDNVNICGDDWLVWGSKETADEYVNHPTKGAWKGSYKHFVNNCLLNEISCPIATQNRLRREERNLNMQDRIYREYHYQGKEYETDRSCDDPRAERKDYKDVSSDDKQLYYMRGYDIANYACDRFLVPEDTDNDGDIDDTDKVEFTKAYDCCVKTSKEYICLTYNDSVDKYINSLERSSEISEDFAAISSIGINSISDAIGKNTIFCSLSEGSCWLKTVKYDIFKGKQYNEICAKTRTLCPYNHNVGGGTQKRDEYPTPEVSDGDGSLRTCSDGNLKKCCTNSENRALSCYGKVRNFCQYNKHCTLIDGWVDYPVSLELPRYFDKACINFVGSSHNTEGYKAYDGYYERVPDKYKVYTAPIVECITETFKNFLYHKAGHTKCRGGLTPNAEGKCYTPDATVYEEGQDLTGVTGEISPIDKVQKSIRTFVKLVAGVAIMLYGLQIIIIGGGVLNSKTLILMLLKISIVLTFINSSSVYYKVFDFVYAASNKLSELTMKISFDDTLKHGDSFVKFDGCFFGNLEVTEMSGRITLDNNYRKYPANRRYISIFDTLDCKFARYMGYGPEASVGTIFVTILGAIISPFGLPLAFLTILLTVYMLSFVLQAAYIFIIASIALTFMLYILPLIIPTILFKKTESIFNGWLKNVIGFALQPMILFAYLTFAFTIIDKYAVGDALYYGGTEPKKNLVCGNYCVIPETVDAKGRVTLPRKIHQIGLSRTTCTTTLGYEFVETSKDSFVCLLKNINSGTWSVLAALGIGLPFIIEFFSSDFSFLLFLRILILMWIVVKVLEYIPSLASDITGGQALPGMDEMSKKLNFLNMAKGIYGAGKIAKNAMLDMGITGGKKFYGKFIQKNKGQSSENKGSATTQRTGGAAGGAAGDGQQ